MEFGCSSHPLGPAYDLPDHALIHERALCPSAVWRSSTRDYQASGPSTLKNPPDGPSRPISAYFTTAAAPSATV